MTSTPSRKTSQLQIRISPEQKIALRNAAQRAGVDLSTWVLSQLLPEPAVQFRQLVDALASSPRRRFVTAQIHDFLHGLSSSAFRVAIADCPWMDLEPYWANYLAAMVEVTAQIHGQASPDWIRRILPLKEPAFGTDLKSLRLHLLTSSPIPFRRRNIFIDSTIGMRV